jgi:hypothetical protein
VRRPGLGTTESVAQDQLIAETNRSVRCAPNAIFARLADSCHHHASLGDPCAMDLYPCYSHLRSPVRLRCDRANGVSHDQGIV